MFPLQRPWIFALLIQPAINMEFYAFHVACIYKILYIEDIVIIMSLSWIALIL